MPDSNEFWNKRREKLEQDVIRATFELFAHMGTAGAFRLPLDENKTLFVIAGPLEGCRSLAAESQRGTA